MGRRRGALIALGLGSTALAALAGAGWWYTFIEGAPQLDAAAIRLSNDLQFRIESFHSAAMGGRRSYGLILPPGYDREKGRRYPVIVLLHGGHDDSRAFFDKYAITATLDQLYRSRHLAPSLIVTPDGNDARGSSPLFDPDDFDGPNGRVGRLIGVDLGAELKRRYRMRPEPGQWALGGVSSGGWGALNIGLRHTGAFHTLFSHNGCFVDASGPANSPEQFIGSLDRLGVASTLHVFPGGHGLSGADVGWNHIRKHLRDSLTFVGRSFAANDGKASPEGRT